VHDVTPESLPKVDKILRFLRQHACQDVTLLVVPGGRWTAPSLAQLAQWQRDGYTLAGHGWHHRADRLHGVGHLLHSLFISRRAAEHLAHDTAGIIRLISRCYAWFGENSLTSPSLYVPPAWAMGRIRRKELAALPFDRYEYLTGFYDVRARSFRAMPLVGFEADSWARFMSLYPLNELNLLLSRMTGDLRIALHPNDLDLLLGKALRLLFESGRFRRAGAVPC
jgi:predicted deacetylase